MADKKLYKTYAVALAWTLMPWLLTIIWGPFWILTIPVGFMIAVVKVKDYFVDRTQGEVAYDMRDRPLASEEEPPWVI